MFYVGVLLSLYASVLLSVNREVIFWHFYPFSYGFEVRLYVIVLASVFFGFFWGYSLSHWRGFMKKRKR